MNKIVDGVPECTAVELGSIIHQLNCRTSNAAARCINDSQQVDIIIMIRNYAQIADNIFDFLAFKKAGSATHCIWNVILQKGFFYKAALCVSPH